MTNLKGNWEVGKKVTILVAGAPGSKPYGNSWEFPKVDEVTLWFLGPEADYRRGTSNRPLLTPNLTGLYKQLPNDTWYNTSDKTEVISLSEVEQTIQYPSLVATQIPANSSTSNTSNILPGQVLNLVQFYNLNDVSQIVLKGGPNPRGIKDKNIIQAVLNALDKPQTVSNDTSLPGSEEKDKHVALIFSKPDDTSLGVDYNFKDNYLIIHSTDIFRIPVSPELSQALDLN